MTTETRAEHTPTPWFVNGPDHIGRVSICNYRDGAIVELVRHQIEGRVFPVEANAEYIARAVNSHDALLAAAIEAADLIETHFPKKMARDLRAAIKQARGE